MPEEPSNTEEEGARELGERIARELVALVPDARTPEGGVYRHLYRTAYLPRWNPTFVEYRRAKALIEELRKTIEENSLIMAKLSEKLDNLTTKEA